MCFSAPASFSSSVLLTVVGTETLRKIHKPSQLVFAGITIFFAFQQFTEGVLWTVIPAARHPVLQSTASYIFIIMAEVLWPVLIPLSVLLMEENKNRKRALWALLAVGLGIAFFYLRHIVIYGVHADISGWHITYKTSPHYPDKLPTFFYLIATLVPFFVSGLKRAYLMGVIMTLSFLVSAVFYRVYLTSVWCFFAAIMSFVVFYIIRDAHVKKVPGAFLKNISSEIKQWPAQSSGK
jgi:hypothetical protein